ncbi:MAG: replication-associated recombination protein A [Planctomycetota bacterium]|nr:MAG: replication-associated recombination protein A [Planctomycetota bacterium]
MSAGDLFGPTGLDLNDPTRPPREDAPLAERLRPQSLAEVLGQKHLLGEGGALAKDLAQGRCHSMVLWGPPGTGKTTLALLLAKGADMNFRPFSAVLSGIKDVRQAMAEAQQVRRQNGRGTLLFVDEIHRFNKAQQDAFLPFVEKGDIVLIGATTENPSFEIIGPLLSRLSVHILQPLTEEELLQLLERALNDRPRGLGAMQLKLRPEQGQALARFASGDARRLLVALEATARLCDVAEEVPDSVLESVFQGRAMLYDKAGENHYDFISALHKSIRSSDPDAALYWLVRMLEGGEDPLYLARRLVRMASEDVGLADPNALRLALSARDAFQFLGSPEGELALAEAAVYLAVAPKSDAVYQAFGKVRGLIRKGYAEPVPMHLRNAPTRMMKEKGFGRGYRHAHQEQDGLTEMECLPEKLAGQSFYHPTTRGVEGRIGQRLQEIRAEIQRRRQQAPNSDPDA